MKERSRSTAYAALAAALGTVLLYLASVLPAGKLAVVCVASLCTVFVQTVCGWKWAVGTFIVTAALSLLLLPTKAVALLFAALFGYYPIVKLFAERLRNAVARWGVKLLLFNGVMAALYFLVRSVFDGSWGPLSAYPLLMLLCANVAFVLYDLALGQGILFFMRNIARRIK